jgi:hypothetical protein
MLVIPSLSRKHTFVLALVIIGALAVLPSMFARSISPTSPSHVDSWRMDFRPSAMYCAEPPKIALATAYAKPAPSARTSDGNIAAFKMPLIEVEPLHVINDRPDRHQVCNHQIGAT